VGLGTGSWVQGIARPIAAFMAASAFRSAAAVAVRKTLTKSIGLRCQQCFEPRHHGLSCLRADNKNAAAIRWVHLSADQAQLGQAIEHVGDD
jgi:hypothetical protein